MFNRVTGEDLGYSHERLAHELEAIGAVVIGRNGLSTGWPDILARIDGRVFAIEAKAGYDTLKPHQRQVIEAMPSIEKVYIVREGGKLSDGELRLPEMLAEIRGKK